MPEEAASNNVDVADLVALCTRIQQHANAIPVRVNLAGHWESKYLSELPAELAVWWAMLFVLRRLGVAEADTAPEAAAAQALAGDRVKLPLPTLMAAIAAALQQWDRHEVAPAVVLREIAELLGVPVKPAPATTSIGVDVADIDGKRVVKLTLPGGADVAGLTPDVADTLARTLAQQARIARSPGGLILPPH